MRTRDLIGLAVLVTSVLFSGCGGGLTEREKRELEALAQCQSAIESVSRNRSQTTVPYVKNQGSDSQFRFSWARGSGLIMPNGFGALQDASALCVYQDYAVKELVVDGVTIVTR